MYYLLLSLLICFIYRDTYLFSALILIFLWVLGAVLYDFVRSLSRVRVFPLLKKIFNKKKIEIFLASREDKEVVRSLLNKYRGDESGIDIKRFYIAKSKGEIVGCIRTKVFGDGSLELASLGVDCDYQNKGIGSALVRKIIKEEIKRPIYLLTSMDKKGFYEKFGFVVMDEEKLSGDIKKEYRRVATLPFAKNLKVVVMKI